MCRAKFTKTLPLWMEFDVPARNCCREESLVQALTKKCELLHNQNTSLRDQVRHFKMAVEQKPVVQELKRKSKRDYLHVCDDNVLSHNIESVLDDVELPQKGLENMYRALFSVLECTVERMEKMASTVRFVESDEARKKIMEFELARKYEKRQLQEIEQDRKRLTKVLDKYKENHIKFKKEISEAQESKQIFQREAIKYKEAYDAEFMKYNEERELRLLKEAELKNVVQKLSEERKERELSNRLENDLSFIERKSLHPPQPSSQVFYKFNAGTKTSPRFSNFPKEQRRKPKKPSSSFVRDGSGGQVKKILWNS